MAVTVLMVAEKPMLAGSIARLLSDRRSKRRKGFNGVCSIHEYAGSFNGQYANFKVTSTCGHVMKVDFPQEYNNWRVKPLELYTCPISQIEADEKMRMREFLASEAVDCDYLVLWLDCDKEGEKICFEVIDAVKPAMKKPEGNDVMDNVYRARFSAITEIDIKAAMQKLGRPNQNIALAVDARQELDLRVGCSFTRFQTSFFRGKYSDLDSKCISYGPCQTPALAFCVRRHDEIAKFVPEPYYVLETEFDAYDGSTSFEADWGREEVRVREDAARCLAEVQKNNCATITDVSSVRHIIEKPQALNTVQLLRLASMNLGLSPFNTMQVAEKLYTKGYISYPRTETTAYPRNEDLRRTLNQQRCDERWRDYVAQIMLDGVKMPTSGLDAGDHPPIMPIREDDGQLDGDDKRVYELVARYFISTLMRSHVYDTTTVSLSCGDEQFVVNSHQMADRGFMAVLPWSTETEKVYSIPPPVKYGQSVQLRSAKVVKRMTQPPAHLTEAELVSLMEEHGIGTDASIPTHINNICKRNYVKVGEGRRLVPTKLGVCLIHGIMRVDKDLVLPNIRTNIEAQLNKIARGDADYKTVKTAAIEQFRLKFLYFIGNVNLIDQFFRNSFTRGNGYYRRENEERSEGMPNVSAAAAAPAPAAAPAAWTPATSVVPPRKTYQTYAACAQASELAWRNMQLPENSTMTTTTTTSSSALTAAAGQQRYAKPPPVIYGTIRARNPSAIPSSEVRNIDDRTERQRQREGDIRVALVVMAAVFLFVFISVLSGRK